MSEHRTKVLQGFMIRDEESPLEKEADKVSETADLCTVMILLVCLAYPVTRRTE